MQAIFIQKLSEVERKRLREISLFCLEERNTVWLANISKANKKGKFLRKRLDVLSRMKKDNSQTFGIPLSQVIANDLANKQQREAFQFPQKHGIDVAASVLRFLTEKHRQCMRGEHSLLGALMEYHRESLNPLFEEHPPKMERRGGISVDSIADLDQGNARLLEALQLSFPPSREPTKIDEEKMGLKPILRQVPVIVDKCCDHIETYGLRTLGIFRVGSSKKRVKELRDEFDQGMDVTLDESQSVHDVAALLKEFLRDMSEPLVPREFYQVFLRSARLPTGERLAILQLLIFVLPPCNCDTLHRLLQFLDKVSKHSEDSIGPQGQMISGNRMTTANLAMVFGPNILQKEKMHGKDIKILGMEESTAMITVLQTLIENFDALYMVPPDVQSELLLSLWHTNPEIIEYLLRQKVRTPLALPETSASDSESTSASECVSASGSMSCSGLESAASFSAQSAVRKATAEDMGSTSAGAVQIPTLFPPFSFLRLPSRMEKETAKSSKTLFCLRPFRSSHAAQSPDDASTSQGVCMRLFASHSLRHTARSGADAAQYARDEDDEAEGKGKAKGKGKGKGKGKSKASAKSEKRAKSPVYYDSDSEPRPGCSWFQS